MAQIHDFDELKAAAEAKWSNFKKDVETKVKAAPEEPKPDASTENVETK